MSITEETKTATRDVVLEAIRTNPGINERELLDLTGYATSKVTPTRIRLWEAGLIEPTTETGWRAALVSRVKGVGWHVVEPGSQAAVAERARARQKRNAKNVQDRALRIVDDLRDPTVHRLVMKLLEEKGISGRQLRRNEEALRKEANRARQEARQATRDETANADMKNKIAHLWDARATVAAIDEHLLDERARVARGDPRRIDDVDWVVALRDVVLILKSFGGIWNNLRDLGDNVPCPVCGARQPEEHRHLQAFAAEGEVVEDVVDGEGVPD